MSLQVKIGVINKHTRTTSRYQVTGKPGHMAALFTVHKALSLTHTVLGQVLTEAD